MYKKRIDITGNRYGRLVAIKEVGSNDKGHRKWLCKCDCGNEKIIYMYSLRTGNTKSCGCLQKEKVSQANSIDLTGETFGRLTALERKDVRSKNGKIIWKCICECGKEIEVITEVLLKGDTKSCGCLKIDTGKAVYAYCEANLIKDGVFIPSLKSKVRIDNKTGVKGVFPVKRKKGIKYQATIGIKHKIINLGVFDTIEEATKARKLGEERYHKPYLDLEK